MSDDHTDDYQDVVVVQNDEDLGVSSLVTAAIVDYEALEHSTITLNVTVTETSTAELLSSSHAVLITVGDVNDLSVTNITTTASGGTSLRTDG